LLRMGGAVPQCVLVDMGMARLYETADSTYMKTKSNVMPLKWSSPESLREKKFSDKSDMYSYGIVVIEVFTRDEPFPEMQAFEVIQIANQKIKNKNKQGKKKKGRKKENGQSSFNNKKFLISIYSVQLRLYLVVLFREHPKFVLLNTNQSFPLAWHRIHNKDLLQLMLLKCFLKKPKKKLKRVCVVFFFSKFFCFVVKS